MKARDMKRKMGETGDPGPSFRETGDFYSSLSAVETRLLGILSWDAVDGDKMTPEFGLSNVWICLLCYSTELYTHIYIF